MMDYSLVLEKYGNNSFSRNELLSEVRQLQPEYSEENFKKSLSRLIKSGRLMRVAKGIYIVPESKKHIYSYESMNSTAIDVKARIEVDYPLVDFVMFEMVQLNQFVNHQIAMNTIFIETEKDTEEAIFERLKANYNSVLYFPSSDDLYRHGAADSIVVKSLHHRYPKSTNDKHSTSIEKLIVDLFANKLIWESISQGDYPEALRNMFSRYQINETSLFRYAIMRCVDKELKAMLKKAEIRLYTDKGDVC